ncbi:hypothetical protein [uncultured Hymenobacter sp.]|uniref:hypothetical protein n=1 Tax=uncultured Hymenobacter sp. TaxID=170016 RepID=UPI0035CB3D35
MADKSAFAPVAPGVSRLSWGQWISLSVGLLLLLVGLGLWALDPWLRRLLEKQVATQSGGRYELRVGALHTRIWQGTLQLRNLRLRTRTGHELSAEATRLPVVRLELARLDVLGVGLWQVLQRQIVPVDCLALDSLFVRVSSPWPAGKSPNLPLYRQLPFGLPGVRVAQLSVRRVQAAYRPLVEDSISFRRGDVVLRDVLLSQAGAADTQRLAYARTLAVGLTGGRIVAFKHQLALGAIRFSSRRQRLQLDSLVVHPLQPVSDQRTREPRLAVLLPRLVAAGFRAERLATRRLHADTLRLTAPRIGLAAPTVTPKPLHEMLAPWLRQLTLTHFALTRGSLYILGLKQHPNLQDIAIRGTDVRIDSASAGAAGRLYYARNWRLHTGPIRSLLDGPDYKLAYRQLDLETKTGKLVIQGLHVLPTLSATALNRQKGYETPHITALLPYVALHGFDFPAFTRRGQLRMQELEVRAGRLQVLSDGRFPPDPRTSAMTPEALGKLPFRMDIRRVTLRRGTLYTEYRSADNPVPGRLSLTRFSVTLTNITNDPRRMNAAHPAIGHATAWLQNRCRVDVKLVANLLATSGAHRLSGRFGAAPLAILNPMTAEVAALAIRKGQVQAIRFALDFNRRRGWGTVWAHYSDLKVTMLKARGPKRKNLLTRVGTTLLNGLVVRDNNPRRGKLLPGRARATRNLQHSVFTVWQHSLFVGLLHSVGVPAQIAQQLIEDE